MGIDLCTQEVEVCGIDVLFLLLDILHQMGNLLGHLVESIGQSTDFENVAGAVQRFETAGYCLIHRIAELH